MMPAKIALLLYDHRSLLCFLRVCSGPRCDKVLGMGSGRIRNSQISSSSSWDRNHEAYLARLNHRKRGHLIGAWSAKYNNRYQWIKVDFRRPTRLVMIASQGRQDARQWVTQYYVTYSQDGIHWAEYKIKGSRKVIRFLLLKQ